MATTEAAQGTLQELAKRHLWMHFSRLGAYGDGIFDVTRQRSGRSSIGSLTLFSLAKSTASR